MKKIYAYNHQPIYFDFKQTVDRFFVEEIPIFNFIDRGPYLILKIKKSDISTFKLISIIAQATNSKYREIGYAGLKDKNATTIQYISIPEIYERDIIKNLTTQKIEILDSSYSKFPIKIGQLKGNKFAIILNRVTPKANLKIREIAQKIHREGMPNYYGYQRFGKDNRSYIQGREIAHSGKRLRGAKEKLLVSAYQSHLFNEWLSTRISISKTIYNNSIDKASKLLSYPKVLLEVLAEQPNFFKLFIGDDMRYYPDGKSYPLQDLNLSCSRFLAKLESPTGLVCGAGTDRALSDARYLEEKFDDAELYCLKGDRRFAWVWPENLAFSYDKKRAQLRFQFYLPKGSYATTFLEEIAKRSLK